MPIDKEKQLQFPKAEFISTETAFYESLDGKLFIESFNSVTEFTTATMYHQCNTFIIFAL